MPSLFISVLALWLVMRWSDRRHEKKAVRYLFLTAYTIGLGNGFHLTVLLVAPTVLLLVLFAKPRWFSEKKLWLYGLPIVAGAALFKHYAGLELLYVSMAVFALTAPFFLHKFSLANLPEWERVLLGILLCGSLYTIGYSVYPTVMVRAGKSPEVNVGNPDTWNHFKLYLDRDQYTGGSEDTYSGLFQRKESSSYQFGYMYLRYLIRQFPKWGPAFELSFENDKSPNYPGQAIRFVKKGRVSILLLMVLLYGLFTHIRYDWARFTSSCTGSEWACTDSLPISAVGCAAGSGSVFWFR